MTKKILTIEELAQQGEVDVSEYGLKAEGLVILRQVMQEFRADPSNKSRELEDNLQQAKEELMMAESERQKERAREGIAQAERDLAEITPEPRIDFEVDPAFVIPRSLALDDTPAMREAYSRIVSLPTVCRSKWMLQENPFTEYSPLRIVMARSSDENELPGVFESHPSLYDPSDLEGSFKRWMEAARKVRESGARGVIGQVLVASGRTPSSFIREYDEFDNTKVRLEEGEFSDDLRFGLDSYSFVSNTGGFYGANQSSITAVIGLPSKIVRGDEDFSLIMDSKLGYTVFHSKNNYLGRSAVGIGLGENFPQETIDVINVNNPGEIETMRFIQGLVNPNIDMQLGRFAFPPESMYAWGIMDIMERLRTKTGTHVELEGTWSEWEYFPHIIQLRKYCLPESRLEQLTDVDPARIVHEKAQAFGADRFSGDLVYIMDAAKIDEEALREKVRDGCIILAPYGKVPYIHDMGIDFEKLDVKGMVLGIINQRDRYNAGAHTFGLMMCLMTEIQKKTPVISLGYLSQYFNGGSACAKLGDRIERYDGFTIIRNVTVESDGNEGQVYLNE